MDSALNLMKELAITAAIILGVMCLLALCFWMYPSMTEMKKMDCSLVEFSPDISAEIKELCREARSKT